MTSTQTQGQKGAKRVFDNAVVMLNSQPEAALSIFRSIRNNTEGPLSQAAGEQLINALYALGRLDEAQTECEQLMSELRDDPKRSYFWARIALRWAENAIANGQESEVAQVLEQAESIFELNADYLNVGKVADLKAAISTAKGDYEKADRQAQRGQRLVATHLTTNMPDATRRSPSEMAGIGNSGSNN